MGKVVSLRPQCPIIIIRAPGERTGSACGVLLQSQAWRGAEFMQRQAAGLSPRFRKRSIAETGRRMAREFLEDAREMRGLLEFSD